MRTDLNKQLCEHERYSSSDSYSMVRHSRRFNSHQGADPELMATRESMVKRGRTKSFGENLNPLFGAVRKAVGRPWNSFYSDLCKSFDKRSVINQHIIQHLFQYVQKDGVYVEDGQLYVQHANFTEKLRDSSVEFFVDPRDGILRRNKYYKSYNRARRERVAKAKAEKAKLVKVIDSKNILRFDEEKKIWYHYTIDTAPVADVKLQPKRFTEKYEVRQGARTIEKTWDELSASEKDHYGELVYDLFSVRFDALTEYSIAFNGKSTVQFYGRPTKMFPFSVYRAASSSNGLNAKIGEYHKTKQTASHKMLKKAGLID